MPAPLARKRVAPRKTLRKTSPNNPNELALKPKKLSRKAQAKALVSEEEVELFIKNDPTKSNKYLVWMAKQKKAGYNNEDIIATVKSFDRRQKSLKHQDIYKYNDLKKLEKEILSLKTSKSERKYLRNLKSGTDYISLMENNAVRLYYVLSMRGIRNLGKNTRWCIATNSSYWSSYNTNNDVFVVMDAKNEDNKFALLRASGSGNYTLYNKNDTHINLNTSFSPRLVNEIDDLVTLILKISGKFRKTGINRKSYLLSSPNEGKPEKEKETIEALAEKVRENSLLPMMPFSKNEKLIAHLKDEIKTYLGKIVFQDNYSAAFLKVFKSEISGSEESVRNFIIKNSLSTEKIKEFGFVLDALSEDEYLQMLNKIEYKKTKESFIRYCDKHWQFIPKKDINQRIALALLREHGPETLMKTCHLFGKRRKERASSYYPNRYYYYDSDFTKTVRKTEISRPLAVKIMAQKGCPASLKTHFNKNINKILLTKKQHSKFKDLINIYIGSSRKKQIKIEDFNAFLNEMSTKKFSDTKYFKE